MSSDVETLGRRTAAPPADAALLSAREETARARLAPIAAEYPFRPRFFAHGPHLQHYVDEGPRASSALVFVHGNPTWSFAWRRFVRALSPGRRCIAVDHVGCGLSDKPGDYPYRLAGHVENLERLLLSLGLERITLVLHDWGGPIGLGFARRHPQLVERIVLSNTAAFQAERLPLRLALCRVPVLGRLAVQGLNAFARGATFMAVERPLPPLVKRGYLLPYDDFANRVATLRFVEDIPLASGHPSFDELAAIERSLPALADRPALLLWGERDWCFTPRYRERWQAILSSARTLRFPEAGHYVFEDAGEAFERELTRFLEETDA